MKILMTGSGGTVGRALIDGLDHDVTGYDLPESDILNFEQLSAISQGHDVVVHLAWSKHHDDWLSERFDPSNLQGAYNVLEAAQVAGVKRVVIASSVHADDFVRHGKAGLLQPYSLPIPDSPYGAAKCMIEALGRYYANAKGLEVVCVRLGGVNRDDRPPSSPPSERDVWISQRDCVSLFDACISAPTVPKNYAIIYGISANKNRIHDLTNPFGWQPQDGTE